MNSEFIKSMFYPYQLKRDFPILSTSVYGKSLVYLDNAATSQKPKAVLEAMDSFYKESNANIHRGVYYLSEKATSLYEDARKKAAHFIGAKDPSEIIFTRGTTESLNLLAFCFTRAFLKRGDKVLITQGEHHSNVIPWQIYLPLKRAALGAIKLDAAGRLDWKDFQKKLTKKVKLVSIAHASNSSGVIHEVKKIIELAHSKGILVCLDAAQSAPHMPINVQELGCDFLVFSGHKMLGPTGIGVLYGRRDLLEKMEPYQGGGGMIREVHLDHTSWADVPAKFEAGTPNIAGAIGLAAAIDYLNAAGLEAIAVHEQKLTQKLLEAFRKDSKIQIFGPKDLENRCGIVSFGIKGVHPHDMATVLDQDGIAIRAGHHCAQMMMESWHVPATARVSFYLYNTEEDVSRLISGLEKVKFIFRV